jgi:hypothetical protein
MDTDPSATKHWLGVAGSETHVPFTEDADATGGVGPGVNAAVVGAGVVEEGVIGLGVVGLGVVGEGVVGGGPPQAGVPVGGGLWHCSKERSGDSDSKLERGSVTGTKSFAWQDDVQVGRVIDSWYWQMEMYHPRPALKVPSCLLPDQASDNVRYYGYDRIQQLRRQLEV